jgi:hypothetical protein
MLIQMKSNIQFILILIFLILAKVSSAQNPISICIDSINRSHYSFFSKEKVRENFGQPVQTRIKWIKNKDLANPVITGLSYNGEYDSTAIWNILIKCKYKGFIVEGTASGFSSKSIEDSSNFRFNLLRVRKGELIVCDTIFQVGSKRRYSEFISDAKSGNFYSIKEISKNKIEIANNWIRLKFKNQKLKLLVIDDGWFLEEKMF